MAMRYVEVPIEILDWDVVEHWEKTDYVYETTEGRKVIEGRIKFAGIIGKFKYEEFWETGNGGCHVEVDIQLNPEIKEIIEEYIRNNARELFRSF
jgi:hypothetical protein